MIFYTILAVMSETCKTQGEIILRMIELIKALDYHGDDVHELLTDMLRNGVDIYENTEEQSDEIIELNHMKDLYWRSLESINSLI